MTLHLSGAEALLRCLQAEGVGHVFGIASGKLTPLMHALSQTPELRFTGVRHEASGAIMAAGIAAGTGRIAVALGEMAPGGINLAAGAGVAFDNSLPALFVTTNQHRAAAYPHRGMFMDLDTRAVFAPLTKWNAVAGDVRRLPELLRTAFRQALGGRPGPVHIDIPQDVLAARADFADAAFDIAPARYRATEGPRPAAAPLAAAAALLRAAERPLIVAGGGVVAAGAAPLVRELAARLAAPVVPTQMALGVVASDSPHFIGHGGLIAGPALHAAFEQADAVLSLGCRHSSWLWDEHGPFVRPAQRHVQVNIDPMAVGEPALHTIGIVADAAAAAADLLDALDGHAARGGDWLAAMRRARAADETVLTAMADAPAGVTPPAAPVPPTTDAAAPVPSATDAAAPMPPATDAPAPVPSATDAAAPEPPATNAAAPVPPALGAAAPVPPAMCTSAPVPPAQDAAALAPPAMHPAALARAIGRALPHDALAVYDGGHTSFWSNDLTPVHDVRTRFHDPGMCQLGFGLPYALALQLAHPGRPVFQITGDGSFGFTLQELDTARRQRLNVVTLIHNNASWGVIRSGQRRQFDFEFATGLDGSDYAAIARGFGCHGETVEREADIAPAIARALASGLPAVVDCRTRFVPHPCMPAFGSMNRYAGAA